MGVESGSVNIQPHSHDSAYNQLINTEKEEISRQSSNTCTIDITSVIVTSIQRLRLSGKIYLCPLSLIIKPD